VKDLPRGVLLSAFARCFVIQGSWNYHTMLGSGFAFALLPVLRHLAADPDALERAVDRHLELFNAHPYLSGVAVGAVAIVLGILFEKMNVSYLVGWAFSVAASANLPVILLSVFWKGFTTRGAVWGLAGGLGSSILLLESGTGGRWACSLLSPT